MEKVSPVEVLNLVGTALQDRVLAPGQEFVGQCVTDRARMGRMHLVSDIGFADLQEFILNRGDMIEAALNGHYALSLKGQVRGMLKDLVVGLDDLTITDISRACERLVDETVRSAGG